MRLAPPSPDRLVPNEHSLVMRPVAPDLNKGNGGPVRLSNRLPARRIPLTQPTLTTETAGSVESTVSILILVTPSHDC